MTGRVLAEKRIVTRIWHPAPEGGPLFDVGAGVNAEVLTGDPAYQLTSGEIVAITEDNPATES